MKVKIFVPDIECESCVKLLEKKLKYLQGVKEKTFYNDSVDVTYDSALITPENIVAAIREMEFRASVHPFERKTVKERVRDWKENRHKYQTEIAVLKYAVYLFLILGVLESIAYLGFFTTVPFFLQQYGWWLLYLNLSVATLGAALWHYLSYQARMTSMVGMMIGMTLGMQTGLMLGAVLGATNGFFIGATAGLVLGVCVGALAGSCCGIMGILEGVMAGVMGGTMGAMISVMMLSDHILWFMPVYMIVNIFVLLGFSYMLYEEVVEGREGVTRRRIDFFTFASGCIIITAVLSSVMIYGLKSFIVGGV
ncbi:MAG TPA: cation transporter [Candidatus Nanoarchaeia archaeon]|nr:cation transporter [Candidatus Nanoarchaeia archaeon]